MIIFFEQLSTSNQELIGWAIRNDPQFNGDAVAVIDFYMKRGVYTETQKSLSEWTPPGYIEPSTMPLSERIKLLHGRSQEVADRLNDDECGEFSISYTGSLGMNYPWVYADYNVGGTVTLNDLKAVENLFSEFCPQIKVGLLDIRLTPKAEPALLRVKMILQPE